jgi:hypothetical protein
LSSLVFTPNNRRGVWIIDKNRRFAPFETPFPRSYLDKENWVNEPSGRRRVIARAYDSDGLYELDFGAATDEARYFRRIPGSAGSRFSKPYLLPQSRELLVVRRSSDSRSPPESRLPPAVFVVGKEGLVPWRHDAVIWKHGIKSPSFHWSDELNAIVIFDSSDGMANYKPTVHVLKDGSITDVGTLRAPGHRLEDLSGQQAALVMTPFSVARLVAVRTPEGTEKYRLDALQETKGNGAMSHFLASNQHGKVLYVKKFANTSDGLPSNQSGSSFWRWFQWSQAPRFETYDPHPWRIQIVERDTLKDLDVVLVSPKERSISDPVPARLASFPDLEVTLLVSNDALYTFDGTALHLVENSHVKDIGEHPRFAGAATIGRLLMATNEGLYEIVGSTVRPLDIPELSGPRYAIRFLKDWEAAGVVIVKRENELYVIDRDLKVQRVHGSHALSRSIDFVGEQPGSGDIVINGADSVLLVVDTARHGRDLCHR